jgi:hypothetical protein
MENQGKIYYFNVKEMEEGSGNGIIKRHEWESNAGDSMEEYKYMNVVNEWKTGEMYSFNVKEREERRGNGIIDITRDGKAMWEKA